MKLNLLLYTLFINILANAQLPTPKSDNENIIQAQADFLFENEDYLKAKLKYDTIIENSNYESIDLYYRGLCKYNLNDNVGAIVDFTKTLKLLKDTDLSKNWMHGERSQIVNNEYQNMQGAVLFNHYYYHLFFTELMLKWN